ncbi:hypothetical protein ACM66B_000237 [Microbotryomycetes sp. NB124-2]
MHEYSNFDAAPGETQEAASAHDNERQTTMQLDLPSPPPRFSPLPHDSPPPEPLSDKPSTDPSTAEDNNKMSTDSARAAGQNEAEPEAVQDTLPMEPPEQASQTMAVDDIFFDAFPELDKDKTWHEAAKTTTNPGSKRGHSQLAERTVEAEPDANAPPSRQLAPRVIAQGKKRSKPFTLPPKPPAHVATTPWQFSTTGKLFQHRAQILPTTPTNTNEPPFDAWLNAIVNQGSEVIAIDSVWFKRFEVPLQLALTEVAGGVTFGNNSKVNFVGQTRLHIQVGESEVTVEARVFDSGGAFELLLGQSWLQRAHMHKYPTIERMVYPVRDGWRHLINKNPKVVIPDIDLALDADLITTSRFVQRQIVSAALTTMPKILLVTGRHPAGIPSATLSAREVKLATELVLQQTMSDPIANFWAGIEGQEYHADVQAWSGRDVHFEPSAIETAPAALLTGLRNLLEDAPPPVQPSDAERMTEILRLIHFGDDKPGGNDLNESKQASLEALVAEYPDVWALSLDELDTTDTVKCTIPLHKGSQATQPSFRRRFTNPKH